MNKPTAPDPAWIIAGKVGRPFGIHGFLKIYSYTEPVTNLLDYQPWYLKSGRHNPQWQPIAIAEAKPLGKGLTARFAECDTPEQARIYVNHLIGIKRSQLPTPKADQYYWADLLGLKVYNTENVYLGEVVEILETGANDVLVVKKIVKNQATAPLLIPYVLKKIILNIDLDAKMLLVDWHEDWG